MTERETVVGRLGQEPLMKSTPKGEVVEFTLARGSRLLGPDGRWVDGETTWYRVSAWDRLGANVARSLHKGQPVIVHGLVYTDRWVGRDGDQRSELRIRATAIGHDLNNGTATFARPDGGASAPAQTPPMAAAPQIEPAVQGAVAAASPMEGPGAGWNPPLASAPAPAGHETWATLALAEDEAPF